MSGGSVITQAEAKPSVADPYPLFFWPLDPDPGKFFPDPGSRITDHESRTPTDISESFFYQFLGLKILKLFVN
jgi:hypothetical protein